MIEIEFVGTNSLAGRVIKWGTMSDIDHAQFVLADGRRLGAMPGQGVAYGPPPAAGATVERHKIDAPQSVIDFAVEQLGKPYDWGAVLAIGARITLNRDWRETDRWFCSELVAAAFEAGGVPLVHARDLAVITPRDLTLSTRLNPAS